MTASELISRVCVAVGGLPEGLASQLLRGALDELCTQSGAWTAKGRLYVRAVREGRSMSVPDGYQARAGAEIPMPAPADGVKRVAVEGLPAFLSADVEAGSIIDVGGTLAAGETVAWTDVLAPRGDPEARPGAEIALPKVADGARRVGIFGLTWRGSRPYGAALVPDVHRGVLVDRAGYVKAGDLLEWVDVLTPEAADWSDVPEEVLGVLAPAAEQLAKARAFEMPRRPWSDPALAQLARREYSRELNGLLRRQITGNSFGPLVAAVPEAFFDE